MADFLSNLWESVFTPGPTPTLLVATNVTFGALQVLLFTLLIATYSVHFAILSVLCGGLWYSVNWFARELALAQEKEVEAERLRKKQKKHTQQPGSGGVVDSADDEGAETEVEGSGRASAMSKSGLTSGVQKTVGGEQARLRKTEENDRSDISTDSEWEKVDDER